MRAIFEWLLDGLSPRRCPACGEPGSRSWCSACGAPELGNEASSIGLIPLFTAGNYAGSLGAAIRRFKYQGHPELAAPLGKLLLHAALPLAPFHDSVFVPVPLHFERLVERGFNQSALLARTLSRSTGARYSPRLLIRQRSTLHQARLGRRQRGENIRGAFEVRGRLERAVILVDDVVTTGATAQACIDALGKHAVSVRGVIAIARSQS
jgi:ComF family protein